VCWYGQYQGKMSNLAWLLISITLCLQHHIRVSYYKVSTLQYACLFAPLSTILSLKTVTVKRSRY
jgi:hypothetical protein